MQKSDLKPGMKVRHKISKTIGEVWGNEDGTLQCIETCTRIRRRITSGRNKGKYVYPIWNLENLEMAS